MELRDAAIGVGKTIAYFTGTDRAIDQIRSEQEIIRQDTGNPHASLPTEASFAVASRIYAERAKSIAISPLVVLSRITGIDGARRLINHVREQRNQQ